MNGYEYIDLLCNKLGGKMYENFKKIESVIIGEHYG